MSARDDDQRVPTVPTWETRAKKPLVGGLWPGTDKSMWLWRVVPMAAVTDARTERDLVAAQAMLERAFDELAALSKISIPTRRMSKDSYRQFHAELISIPAGYRAPEDSPLRDWLNREHRFTETTRRVLLFGVRLLASTGTGGWKSAIASVAETLSSGQAPLSDYERDIELVSAAMARCGFLVPDASLLHLADSWWLLGRIGARPVVTHPEHIHFFDTVEIGNRMVAIDPDDCTKWPEGGWHAVTFAAVDEFDLGYRTAADPIARWAVALVDRGAHAISIRGAVEPARVTRTELRGQVTRYRGDLDEQAASNKLDRAELATKEQELTSVENEYAEGGPPTLTGLSVLIGFNGIVPASDIAPQGLNLSPMLNRQAGAWHEMMACSNVRANPLTHDVPSTTIAYAGLTDLDAVGDRTGALIGLTERSRQPVYVAPTAAANMDALPLMTVLAGTRSGKTTVLQLMADQFDRMGVPQLIVNPKQGTSLADFLEYGSAADRPRAIYSLSDFTSSDGALDPLRMFPDRTEAVRKATSMIGAVNPFGDASVARHLTDIGFAVDYGSRAGATVTGQALRLALDAGQISEEIARPIFRYAETSPMFRATFGMDPGAAPLRLGDGMTLIEVGDSSFDLPPEQWVGEASTLQDPSKRDSLNLLRMLLWGGMAALRNRGGVIHFDESWVLEKAAPGDLDAAGRLAGAWNILPILYTQRPTGQHTVGLKGYISRGLIGHLKDEKEALAALAMFGLEGNAEMLRRITIGTIDTDGASVNPDSLQTLRDPSSNRILRGSVFYHVDLRGRVAPVEIVLNPEFQRLTSTTPAEVAARDAERALRTQARIAAGLAGVA